MNDATLPASFGAAGTRRRMGSKRPFLRGFWRWHAVLLLECSELPKRRTVHAGDLRGQPATAAIAAAHAEQLRVVVSRT
jgi:hypothetical protein